MLNPTDENPTDEYLDLVNEMVPRATPEGAYCVGIVSEEAWRRAMQPDRQLLEAAVKCESLSEAVQLFDRWHGLKRDEVLARR